MEHSEKQRGKKKLEVLLVDFRAAVDHCELIDLTIADPLSRGVTIEKGKNA